MKRLIAITGGIGSGKSVVSRILRAYGYPVYDCDSEAKRIMDSDPTIKQQLREQISPDSVRADGSIDRPHIAKIVFADTACLAALNAIVHTAVRTHLRQWVENAPDGPVFVETAILYESGLNEDVDTEWRVVAPDELRIARTIARSNLSRQQVVARMHAQETEPAPDAVRPPLYTIDNNLSTPIIPQIDTLLG